MKRKIFSLLISSILTLASATILYGQTGGNFILEWNALPSAGGALAGGEYQVAFSAGEAVVAESSGGNFTLDSGYVPGAVATPNASNTPTATPTHTPTTTPILTATQTYTPTVTSTASATPCATKPAKPALISPANGAHTNKTRVQLTWDSVPCITKYKVAVKQGSKQGPNVDSHNNLPQPSYKTKALAKGHTYWWWAKACNAFGCARSAWFSFTINP